ncbi:MAG TPA: META domain-containing protein [Sphingomicrobium sp.]|nr:META domain-containing protein [Sphingomicrobium sp.]
MAAAVSRPIALALACAACTSINADERTFAGTDWRVSTINARPTPPGPDFHMEFGARDWRGGFGCNGMTGEYRLHGDELAIGRSEGERFFVGRIMATERDCSARPDGHFEGEALAILQRPMRMHWSSGRRLKLSNAAGSIELKLQR